jgi:glc operon protein GlcG
MEKREMRSLKQVLGTAVLILAAAAAGQAQVAERKSLTLDGAKRVIAAAQADARSRNAPGAVIAVVDEGGNLMALERLDGTFAAGATISVGKARTAVLFKKPTKVFEDIIRNGRTPMVALPDSLFTPLQGGVPIIVDGQVVGGVGVSGAASAQQDEELAIAGANAIAGNPTGATAPVIYFDKEQVSAGFSKGAVLVDGANGRNYMVHASHREKSGSVEVHLLDADIIYVIEGSATLVTGGTVVDGKTVEPNEIRGTSVQGGETRRITKGDVIVIPAGTPHWFKEVPGPINYYVVKVR